MPLDSSLLFLLVPFLPANGTNVLLIVLFQLKQLLLGDAIALSMNPVLALVTGNEILIRVLTVSCFANLAEVATQTQVIALLADSVDPLVPQTLAL